MEKKGKKILFVVEAVGGVFTYIVDQVCLNDGFEIEVNREMVAA